MTVQKGGWDYFQSGWTTDNELKNESQAGSISSYGNYPSTWFLAVDSTAADTNANTAVYTSGDISQYNEFNFSFAVAVTTGFKIEITHDGTNWQTGSNNRQSAVNTNDGAIDTAATLATTTSGSFQWKGKVKGLRVIQLGAGSAGQIRGGWGVS